MRLMPWTRAVLMAGAALAAGCRRDDDDDKPRTYPEAEAEDVLTYGNGHPILTESEDPVLRGVEEELMSLTNRYRVAQGLHALAPHSVARQAARGHARHMLVHGFFSHVNPENDGPGERLLRARVRFAGYGENIAAGHRSAQIVFDAWLNSPSHRANLDDPTWTHAGMGHWRGGSYGTYYVQQFLLAR